MIDVARDWLAERRWARVGLQVAAAVLLLAVLGAGGLAWHRAREARGTAALGEALALAQRAEAAPADAAARERAARALEDVVATHSGLSAVAQAAYELGNLRYAAGQHAQARAAYELALAKGATGTLRALAATGVGYTWEAEKNYAGAVQAYQSALTGLGPKDFLYEEALLSLARAQALAGKPDAALQLYERALKDVPDSRRAEDVKARIAALKSRPR